MIKKILVLFFLTTVVLLPQKFRFAVWGDSQFQNPEVFEETVRRTELLKPDFVVHVGDMIHGYTYSIDNARRQWKRFKQQISPLTSPFYPTPGNHDVTTKEIQPAYLETWGEDKLFYSFDYHNSHFIILNAFLDQKFDSIPVVEQEWLKADLEKAKRADNIFVSVHSPLHLSSKFDWSVIHNLLKNYPVKAVFTGHYHYYDFREIDNIQYFCINSSGNMPIYNELAGRSHNFLWVTVEGKEIDIAVITTTNIYKPDFVLPGELSNGNKVLEGNQTILVNTSVENFDTTIIINLKNNSERSRYYSLFPKSKNNNWEFPWTIKSIQIKSGASENIPLRFIHKGRIEKTYELPEIEITSDYYTLKNERTDHKFSYYLFDPPVVQAYKTEEEILLDGLSEEKIWLQVQGVNNLHINRDMVPAQEQTTVKILYDSTNIYIYISGEEPNPGGLTAAAYGDIPLVFGDDDFEIYFDTNRDLKTFYRLMVNPAGTVLCSGPEGLFSFNFDVKTSINHNSWSAEFRIPFKELGINIVPTGKNWGFNVRRHRQQAEIPQSDWSKMNTFPPYQPEYFGILRFN